MHALALLLGLLVAARVGSAATLKTRSDDGRSLFGPSGKPAAEDVTNFFQDFKLLAKDPFNANHAVYADLLGVGDPFVEAFQAVVYGLSREGQNDRFARLFNATSEDEVEISFFGPMAHKRDTKTVKVDDVKGYYKLQSPGQYTGSWWVAALFSTLRDQYKAQSLDLSNAYPGFAGQSWDYFDALNSWWPGLGLKSGEYGSGYDGIAKRTVHWMLSVLLARNIDVGAYAADIGGERFRQSKICGTLGSSPAVWFGRQDVLDTNDKEHEYYHPPCIIVSVDEAQNIVLGNGVYGDDAATIKSDWDWSLGKIGPPDLQPLIFLLADAEEEDGPDWYDRKAPAFTRKEGEPVFPAEGDYTPPEGVPTGSSEPSPAWGNEFIDP